MLPAYEVNVGNPWVNPSAGTVTLTITVSTSGWTISIPPGTGYGGLGWSAWTQNGGYWQIGSGNWSASFHNDTLYNQTTRSGSWDTSSGAFPSSMTLRHPSNTTITFDTSQPQTYTITVQLQVRNNLNRAQTITLGGVSRNLAGLASSTMYFQVSGPLGAEVSFGSSPDILYLDANYDPLLINASGETVIRAGHIGEPPAPKEVHICVVNYAMTTVNVPVQVDGNVVGQISAAASLDGIVPKSTWTDTRVMLSPESSITFPDIPGHTISVQHFRDGTLLNYIVYVDKASSAQSSTTPPNGAGQVTTVTTDPNTGATTIDRTGSSTPTNTDLNPGTAFGGSSGGNVSNGTNYANTSQGAASAAAQDMSNNLANIDRNIQLMADDTRSEQSKVAEAKTSGNETTWGGWIDQAKAKADAAPKIDESKLPGGTIAGGDIPTERPGLLGSWMIGSHEIKITLDPTDSVWNGAHNLLHACRELILWALVIWFCWSTINYCKNYMANLPLIQQVQTTSDFYQDKVPLLSMLKGWFTASALVAAAIVCVGAIIGLVNTHLGAFGFTFNRLNELKDMTATGGAGAILSDYLPLGAIVQLGVARVIIAATVLPIYQGAATAIKFIRI